MRSWHTINTLLILTAFAMTLATVPICAAAGGCGMECCKVATERPSVTKGGECCRIESARDPNPSPAVESTQLSYRSTAGSHAVVLPSAVGSVLALTVKCGGPTPPGLIPPNTAIPLFILNASLLI